MKELRIIQLIDSLETGGAERMAVNYANALQDRVAFSGLVATRKQGALRNQLDSNVQYLFLNKRRKFDWFALQKLRQFVKLHRVSIVQAHSTSFFLAVLLKLICPNISIIWHDHYGNSEFLAQRPSRILQLCARFFAGVISVNKNLQDWAKMVLHVDNVLYLPNFVIESAEVAAQEKTILHGSEGKRILLLANLRAQKGHFFLLEIAEQLSKIHPDWSFHLVGKDFGDAYADAVKQAIIDKHLTQTVFIYGSRNDIANIISQASIGILTSHSEGLPVALLEYGFHGLPVVVTAVGQIPDVMHEQNFVVAAHDVDAFTKALQQFISNSKFAASSGASLRNLIYSTFVADAVLGKYLHWLTDSLKK